MRLDVRVACFYMHARRVVSRFDAKADLITDLNIYLSPQKGRDWLDLEVKLKVQYNREFFKFHLRRFYSI